MAVTNTKSTWKLTAASDSVTFTDNRSNLIPFKVLTITAKTIGTSGQVEVLDGSGGQTLYDFQLDTNDEFEKVIDGFVDGIFVNTLPAAAEVYVVVE